MVCGPASGMEGRLLLEEVVWAARIHGPNAWECMEVTWLGGICLLPLVLPTGVVLMGWTVSIMSGLQGEFSKEFDPFGDKPEGRCSGC